MKEIVNEYKEYLLNSHKVKILFIYNRCKFIYKILEFKGYLLR